MARKHLIGQRQQPSARVQTINKKNLRCLTLSGPWDLPDLGSSLNVSKHQEGDEKCEIRTLNHQTSSLLQQHSHLYHSGGAAFEGGHWGSITEREPSGIKAFPFISRNMLLRSHVGWKSSFPPSLSFLFLSDRFNHDDPNKRSARLLFHLAKARRGQDVRWTPPGRPTS